MLAAIAIAACGNAGASPAPRHGSSSGAGHSAGATGSSTRRASRPAQRPTRVHVSVPVNRYPAALTARWQTITTIGDRPAMWIARRQGVTLVRMNQGAVHLALHAGSVDPGGTGWRYGDAVAGREIHHLILGFNGGFKFSTGSGGFVSFGRIGVPLSAGDGSIGPTATARPRSEHGTTGFPPTAWRSPRCARTFTFSSITGRPPAR